MGSTTSPGSTKIRYFKKLLPLVIIVVAVGIYEFLERQNKRISQPSPSLLTREDQLVAYVSNLRMPDWTPPSGFNQKLSLLGQKLFFDPQFSANGQLSCATCHDPTKSFTDGRTTAAGIGTSTKNSPTLINANMLRWFFYDGRADSLAAQVLGPIENSLEHGISRGAVVKIMANTYRNDFEQFFGPMPDGFQNTTMPRLSSSLQVSEAVAAFALASLGDKEHLKAILRKAQREMKQPVHVLMAQTGVAEAAANDFDQLPSQDQDTINQWFANFGLAIAEFEKTIRTEASPFDKFALRFLQSRKLEQSLDRDFGLAEVRGLELFSGRAKCFQCHHGPMLSDQQFHNIGLKNLNKNTLDLGRAMGILLVKQNPFNCRGKYLNQSQGQKSETCQEMDFVEVNESDLVGAFKTPTLRNISHTAPYGHDGRFKTLREVLDFYNNPDVDQPAVGHRAELVTPLDLKDDELKDLEAFLRSLYGNPKWGTTPQPSY